MTFYEAVMDTNKRLVELLEEFCKEHGADYGEVSKNLSGSLLRAYMLPLDEDTPKKPGFLYHFIENLKRPEFQEYAVAHLENLIIWKEMLGDDNLGVVDMTRLKETPSMSELQKGVTLYTV